MIWTGVGSSFFLPPVCCVDIFCVISFFLFFFGLFFHFGAVQTAKTLRSLWKHALFSPLPSVVVHCYTVSACTWPQVADKGESAFFDDGYTEYMTGKRNMAESQLLFWTVEKALLGNGLEFVFFKCWIMVWHNCVCVCEWFTLSLWCYTPLCCVCVSVHPWPFIWIAGALYFCASHVASIFYSLFLISLPLLSPRPLLHRRQTMVLSMLHHTPLRDWLGSCLDDMSRVWCCEETVSARWLQTIIWLFVSNLY